MTRKLAVTVFALSLAALGCGSDEGTPVKTDTSVAQDGPKTIDAVLGPDSPAPTPDTALGPDAALNPDTAIVNPDAGPAVEAGKLDVQGLDLQPISDVARPDGREVDRPEIGQPDGGVRLDVQAPDTVQPLLDGGADAQVTEAAPALDGGPAVDAEIVG